MKRFLALLCIFCVCLGVLTPFAGASPGDELAQVELAAVDPGTALEILYWGAEVAIIVKDGVEYVMEFFNGDGDMGDNVVNVTGGGDGSVALVTKNLLVPEEERPVDSLAGTMASIFGPYTPLTYEVTTYVGDEVIVTTEPVPGLAGLDWPWLCGWGLFAICAYSLFRLMGVVLG